MGETSFDRELEATLAAFAADVDSPVDAERIARSATRPNRAAAGGVVLAVAAAAGLALAVQFAIVALPAPGSTPTPIGTPPASADASPTGPVPPSEIMRLEWDSYDIAYDQATDSLWLAVMHPNEADFLYRVDAATGEFDRWRLPDTTHNGFLTEVAVAEDRAVWLTMEYRLIRFEPDSGSMATLEFPIVQPQADSHGGTWLSGIGVDRDGVWVTRNGLSTLVRIGPLMTEVAKIELGEAYISSEDVAVAGDLLYVLTPGLPDSEGSRGASRGVGIISYAGNHLAFARVQASRLYVASGRVLAGGSGGLGGNQVGWMSASGTVELAAPATSYTVATAALDGAVVTFRRSPSSALIERHAAGSTLELASFPLVSAELCDVPLPRAAPATGSPPCVDTLLAPEITAMTADGLGAVWYVEDVGQGSVLWKIPPAGTPSAAETPTPTTADVTAPQTRPEDIIGEWRLVEGSVDGEAIVIVDDAPISLVFDGTGLGGVSTCNRYGLDGLEIGPGWVRGSTIVQTMMRCSGLVGASEAQYFSALGKVEAYALDDGDLVLTGPEVELRFRREGA